MAWLNALRLQQWPKNLFVLAGLLFGGKWREVEAVQAALATLLLFCLASSVVYLWNDLRDLEQDRLHPRKRNRPMASGSISKHQAGVALAFGLGLLAVALALLHPPSAPYLGIYLLLNLSYSLGLKQIQILDLLLVTSGFILRVLAGTQAVGVPTSTWILLCSGSLAFFLAVAKRRLDLPDGGSAEAPTFRGYTPQFLDLLLGISASWTVLFYGLYCSELNLAQSGRGNFLWTLPFVLFGILHYLHQVQLQKGSGRSLLLDWPLAASVTGWLGSCWVILR